MRNAKVNKRKTYINYVYKPLINYLSLKINIYYLLEYERF